MSWNDWRKPYFNGSHWPTQVQREKAKYYDPPTATGNIAAIDFGTTSCSIACYIRGTDAPYVVVLGSKSEERVLSRILINSDGRVIEFGRDALREYASSPDKNDLHYFDEVKMKLKHSEDIHLEYTIKDSQGTEFYLVEVIAMILKHLKEQLLQFEIRGMCDVDKATDFDWVITVPAIWKPSGKQMMRLAAYMAGLTSDDPSEVIRKLSPVSREESGFRSELERMMFAQPNPHKLSLALEPEVAAIHCKEEARKLNSKCADIKCYMVVDAGGGTVDIATHEVNDKGLIKVVLPPIGNACGGTSVNAAFKAYLGDLVDDPTFREFLTNSDNAADDFQDTEENEYELDLIINEHFEAEKQRFGNVNFEKEDSKVCIRLPYNFMAKYQKKLLDGVRRLNDKHVRVRGNNLHLSNKEMQKFFRPVVDGIKECFNECMSKVGDKIKAVYLAGGLGGCKYIQKILQDEVDNRMPQDHVFRSNRHELAVVSGAVTYRRNPSVVTSRKADATYGTSCICSYNPHIHSTEYQIEEDGKLKCKDLFSPFVHKDDTLDTTMVLQDTFVPIYHDQKIMTFNIYASQQRELKYTVSPNGEPLPGIERLGILKVPMPNTDRDKARPVVLTVDMTQTEFLVQAYDITANTRVAAAIDFCQA